MDQQRRRGARSGTDFRDALASGIVDLALLERIQHSEPDQPLAVIIELRQPQIRTEAILELIPGARPLGAPARGLYAAILKPLQIESLAAETSIIYRIWLDHVVKAQHTGKQTHLRTIKADAALRAFAASGEGVVWALCDTGVAARHQQFTACATLELPAGLAHRSFLPNQAEADPLADPHGHGTHMAGLIAGASATHRGAAPQAKLLSLQVLDSQAAGLASTLIEALDFVWQANQGGRSIRIHGVNLSLGYDFDPEWFACGQSPLCAEVNRLVESGVVVVAAAGNNGYGALQTVEGLRRAPLPLTIGDPGNAELAITAGATHRDQPHTYGVSWFSSKGPTGDGRMKPDLVAPGERVVSACAATLGYREDSGTSAAAALTSGAIAAFLSARPEFIGRPREVKRIFLDSCLDLRRDPNFQGRGLLDLMRALQTV